MHGELWLTTYEACIWYGVQSYIGGHCVYLMIRAIWKSWVGHPANSGSSAKRPRLTSRCLYRTGTPSQTHSPPTPERRRRTTSPSSCFGYALCQPSGFQWKRSDISLPLNRLWCPAAVSHSSSGLSLGPAASVPLFDSRLLLAAARWLGSLSRES